MIKTFISHASTEDLLAAWIGVRLEKEKMGLDIFIDHLNGVGIGDDPQKMIEEINKSTIFIPIYSDSYMQREFCINETKTAIKKAKREKIHIFPIKYKCQNIPKEIKIKFSAFDKVRSGTMYKDFSNEKEWEISYEDLRKKILAKIIELRLLKDTSTEFYQDCELLEVIIRRKEPTTLEIKTAIEVYLPKEEYQRYFFNKLNNEKWLKYLRIFNFFNFNPNPVEVENSPASFSIPYWPVLGYLEKCSKIQDSEVFNNLLQIVEEVTNQKIDNYRTWWYFVKILVNLPNDKINKSVLRYISVWLDSKDTTLQGSEIVEKLLPKFLDSNKPEDWKKAERVVSYLTQIKESQLKKKSILGIEKPEYKTVIDTYWLKDYFIDKKYAEKVGEKCSNKIVRVLSRRIKKFFERNEGEIEIEIDNTKYRLFSNNTYESFYSEPDYLEHEPFHLISVILKRILVHKSKKNEDNTRKILSTFFKDKYLYFWKMAMYIIGYDEENAVKYRDIFFEHLEKDNYRILLDGLFFGDELKHLFENLKQITPKQKNLLIDKIKNGPRKIYKLADRNVKRWKQERYRALSHDEDFKKLYEELKNETKVEFELHPAIGEVETGCVSPDIPPISKEDLVRKHNYEIVEYLNSYQGKNVFGEPDISGLVELFKNVVKEQPERFVNEMEVFLNAKYRYVVGLISGLQGAWRDKKVFDWGKVFEFVKKYLRKPSLLEEAKSAQGEDWHQEHIWIINTIANLLQDGTSDDSWAFSEDYFDVAKEILFLILERQKIQEKEEIRDYVTHALNTSFGKITEALFLLALRIKRVEEKTKKEQVVNWEKNIRDKYEEILKNGIAEGYVWLGRYLPNFYYLDKNWTEGKIKTISPEKRQIWEAFMAGYLFGGKVYDDLYQLMKPHYSKTIDYEFKEKHAEEQLVQHICIGYLRGNEDFSEEGLFGKLLKKWKPYQIKEIIGFFWMQRDYMAELDELLTGKTKVQSKGKEKEEDRNLREKIIEFWRWVYENQYKSSKDLLKEDKETLSEISKLTVFLSKIDSENFAWLIKSASCVNIHFHSSFFIEYLDELKDKGESSKYIGKIFLKMLENFTPDFRQENIISIVEYLYDTKVEEQIEEAKGICNTYGSRGYEFLRPIFEGHNIKK